jgi:DNA-binding GntR family transcriptional regulator
MATPDPLAGRGASLRDTVVDELRRHIVDGELPAGSRLVERQLAADLGVSRVPVREALHALRAEGFVEERPPRGMVVRVLSERDVEDLFDVREALEAVLCRRVAERLDESGRARLQEVLAEGDRALRAGAASAAVRANADFHAVLLSVSHSPLLATLLEPLGGRMRWLLQQHTDPAAIHAEHLRIYEALVAGDADRATTLAREHLVTSRAAARGAS